MQTYGRVRDRVLGGRAGGSVRPPGLRSPAYLDRIEEQLSNDPLRVTRRRKILIGLVPSFEAVPPIWQLAVGEYRVFYDVSQERRTVYVRAVRHKPPHRMTEEIL